MSRTVPSGFTEAFYAEQTGASIPILIEIESTADSVLMRFCNNTEDLTYDGDVYTAYPFVFDFHSDADDGNKSATLTISMVDPSIIEELRGLTEQATIKAMAMFYEDGTFEPVMSPSYILQSVGFSEDTMTGTLVLDDWTQNEFPADEFTPRNTPGVF